MRALQAAIILTLVLLFWSQLTVQAQPEAYALSLNNLFIQEGGNVTASLNVTSATRSTVYSFLFSLVDPSNTLYTSSATHTTGPSETSFTLSKKFPVDFPSPAATRFVGNYTFYVDQTAPTSKPLVQSSTFAALLSDRSSYQRTETIRINSVGYAPGENVNVFLRTTTSTVPGFPMRLVADSTGGISATWQIPSSAVTVSYSLTVNGTSTVKRIPDFQTLRISPAILTIAGFSTEKPSYQRTQTVLASFQALYPSGAQVSSGSAQLYVMTPSGNSWGILTARFNGWSFVANLTLGGNDPVGFWRVRMPSGSLHDGYGNTGPLANATAPFLAETSTLSVSLSLSATSASPGRAFQVTASIRYPDGSPLSTGSVTATISIENGRFLADIPVHYEASSLSWKGSYTPVNEDPPGNWNITLIVSDKSSPANTGQASVLISSSGPVVPVTTTSFLLPVIVGIGVAILAALLWTRKKVTRREFKLDLKLVDSEAQRIQEKKFFKSVMQQVEQKEVERKEDGKSEPPPEPGG